MRRGPTQAKHGMLTVVHFQVQEIKGTTAATASPLTDQLPPEDRVPQALAKGIAPESLPPRLRCVSTFSNLRLSYRLRGNPCTQ
jgi:hypothetical protein